MSVLAADGVRIELGSRYIIDGAQVAVTSGEFVGLIGPNGAGKTTLLRFLAGLVPASGGLARLDGVDVTRLDPVQRARRVAYVEQSGTAAWPIKVSDLVGLGRLPHVGSWRAQGATDRTAVADALRLTEVETLAGRAIDTLSSGERSRVLLARALAGKPDFLLADEPVAALDPAQQLGIMTLLSSQAAQGLGVLCVLHDLPLASRFCHRLILLKQGQVVADGAPDIVLRDQTLADAFKVQAARGAVDGVPYVLPWHRLP